MQESFGTIFMVMTSIVAIPLTMITFYLRSLRDQNQSWQREIDRRMGEVESVVSQLRNEFADWERDYTTKEEWLRECMYARRMIQQLLESTVRLETVICKEEQLQKQQKTVSQIIDQSSFVTDRVSHKSRTAGKSGVTESAGNDSNENKCEGSL